jgi:hypothetical protein
MADNVIEKEKLSITPERERVAEEFPTVESPRKSENVEAMSWMEKLERRFGRTQPQATGDVQDDTKVQPTDPAQSTQPPVTIPVTAAQMQSTAKPDPEIALSWLVIWAKRQIAQLMKQNRKVLFSPEPVEDTKN